MSDSEETESEVESVDSEATEPDTLDAIALCCNLPRVARRTFLRYPKVPVEADFASAAGRPELDALSRMARMPNRRPPVPVDVLRVWLTADPPYAVQYYRFLRHVIVPKRVEATGTTEALVDLC